MVTADAESNGWLSFTVDGSCPLSAATVQELGRVCDRVELGERPGPVIVQVTGTPGADWAGGLDIALVTKWERALRRLEQLPAATVAMATGDCGGTALETLLATDLRVVTPSTRLMIAGQGLPAWPGMSGYRLAQQVGPARIRRALLFGAAIDAATAVALGIVQEVADDPLSVLRAAAAPMAGVPGRETAIRRRLVLDATTLSFDEALGVHLAACDRALRQGVTQAAS